VETVTKGRSIGGLVLLIVLCLAVGAVGGRATSSSVATWYPTLRKPAWNPPPWVFAPVWTVLYLAMAVAAWMVWRKAGFRGARVALGLFAVQLALNAAWSPLFFGLQSPAAGLVAIVVLWIAIVATTAAFWRTVPLAGVLLVPYGLWVSCAAVLNLAIWRLNG